MGHKAKKLTMLIAILVLVSASRSLNFFQLYKKTWIYSQSSAS